MTAEVRIERVENGFVISEGSFGRALAGRTWVAVDPTALAKLVVEVFEKKDDPEPGHGDDDPPSRVGLIEGKQPDADVRRR